MSSRPWLQQHSVLILITFFSECILKPNIWAFSGMANLIRSKGHGGKVRQMRWRMFWLFCCTERSSCNFITLKEKKFCDFHLQQVEAFHKSSVTWIWKKQDVLEGFCLVVLEIKHEITFHLNYHCDFISFSNVNDWRDPRKND